MKKIVSIFILVCFLTAGQGGTCPVFAQEFYLPTPGTRVDLSPEFNPSILKGIKVHPENPLRFDFILDQGDSGEGDLKQKASRLIKYFLASLTIPEGDLWVNLSPYEKNRVIPQSFGLTEMGRDLLAQDYMLKQITASLIYPEGAIGKKFWKRIYEEAAQKYGTTDIPINTFNKVWIVPDKSVIYENAQAGTAYVVESTLKVMLEEDYLALNKNTVILSATKDLKMSKDSSATPRNGINALGSQIVREIVIPELTKEVNEGKSFSQLRQAYNSLILATWYKRKIKDSILAQVYGNKKKISGLGYHSGSVESIYQRYLQAFKKGAYNYIKEEVDPLTNQTIPRKYFSGGIKWGSIDLAQVSSLPQGAGRDLSHLSDVTIDLAMDAGKDNATIAEPPAVHERRMLFLDTLAQLETQFPLIRDSNGKEIPALGGLLKTFSEQTDTILWEHAHAITVEGGSDIGGMNLGETYIKESEIRSPALVFLKLGLYFLENLEDDNGNSFGSKEDTDAFQSFLDRWNEQNPDLPHFDVPMVLHLALAARTAKIDQLKQLSKAVYKIQDQNLLDKTVAVNAELMSFHVNYDFEPYGTDEPDLPIIEEQIRYISSRLKTDLSPDKREYLSSGLSSLLISLALAKNSRSFRKSLPSMAAIKNILKENFSLAEIHQIIEDQARKDLKARHPLSDQRFQFSLDFWGFRTPQNVRPTDVLLDFTSDSSQEILDNNKFISTHQSRRQLNDLGQEVKDFYTSWLASDGAMNAVESPATFSEVLKGLNTHFQGAEFNVLRMDRYVLNDLERQDMPAYSREEETPYSTDHLNVLLGNGEAAETRYLALLDILRNNAFVAAVLSSDFGSVNPEDYFKNPDQAAGIRALIADREHFRSLQKVLANTRLKNKFLQSLSVEKVSMHGPLVFVGGDVVAVLKLTPKENVMRLEITNNAFNLQGFEEKLGSLLSQWNWQLRTDFTSPRDSLYASSAQRKQQILTSTLAAAGDDLFPGVNIKKQDLQDLQEDLKRNGLKSFKLVGGIPSSAQDHWFDVYEYKNGLRVIEKAVERGVHPKASIDALQELKAAQRPSIVPILFSDQAPESYYELDLRDFGYKPLAELGAAWFTPARRDRIKLAVDQGLRFDGHFWFQHGHLHENNILIKTDRQGEIADVKIIDFSYLHKLDLEENPILKNIRDGQKPATLTQIDVYPVQFEWMNLDGWDFSNLDLSGKFFTGSSLKGAKFNNARLERTDFAYAGRDEAMDASHHSPRIIGDLTFISLDGMRTPEDIAGLKAGYEKGLNDRSNVLFVPPDTSGPQDSITAYSAGFVSAMQQREDRFKGATVIDAGSGSGILSLVALHLGAKKVVLIDMMDKQIRLSRALLTAHGYQEGVDFIIVKGDLEDDFPSVEQNLKELNLAADNLIGLANIGIWYGDANINSLKLFNRLGARLIINGGYPVQAANIDSSRHIAGLQQNQAWLAQQGFKVQRTDHQYDKTVSVLVADHAQLSRDLGGIDLNSSKVNLQIQNNGSDIRFKMDEAILEQLRQASGLIPVIVKVQPVGDLKLFLGVTEG